MTDTDRKNLMLIDAKNASELRVALLDGKKKLFDYDAQFAIHNQTQDNIYKAIIDKIVPSLNAIFVRYSTNKIVRPGFLPFSEISPEYYDHTPTPDNVQLDPNEIANRLKEGQELMVQVVKEERDSKGAALTTDISLASSYLVLMPKNARVVGVSRRIEGAERDQMREKLKDLKVPDGMGVILRTAGLNKTASQLQWDLDIQLNLWNSITEAYSKQSGSFLIHQESDLITRAIRDYLRQDVSKVIINDKQAYEQAYHYVKCIRPDFAERLELDTKKTPLFARSEYQIEKQISNAYSRRVQLPSGGNIVIDEHSEALVPIDVNSAGSTKNDDIESTALHTNLEAAEEIACQLRIRGLGGLIVVDFIDMPIKDQRKVENHLRESMSIDRARVQIGRISRFGLLEMSRQRLRPSLGELSRVTCPRCDGQGTIQSVEALVNSLMRLIHESVLKEPMQQLQIQLPIEVATFMVNEKREELMLIEKDYNTEVLIIPNINLQTPQYRIKRIRQGSNQSSNKSHTLVEQSIVKIPEKNDTAIDVQRHKPAVRPSMPTSRPPKRPQTGLIKRLFDSMFGSDDKKTNDTQDTNKSTNNRNPTNRRNPRRTRRTSPQRTQQGENRKNTNDTTGNNTASQDEKTQTTRPPRRSGGNNAPHGGANNRSRSPTRRGTGQGRRGPRPQRADAKPTTPVDGNRRNDSDEPNGNQSEKPIIIQSQDEDK